MNYIYSNVLPQILSLSPQEVLKNLSLWKLVTFPFAPGGLESVALFAFVFYFISSKLESYIEGLKYPLWLFMLTLLQGCILTLVFINSNVVIAGMDGISFYVLVVYALLRSKDKINFLNFPPMPIIAFSLLLGFLWFGLKLVNFSTTGNDSAFFSAIGSSLFGITAGLIHYLQIRLSGLSSLHRGISREHPDIKLPSPEELSIAHSTSNPRMRKYYQSSRYDQPDEEEYLLSNDMDENEDKLNQILDKISLSGKDSLTTLERRFLTEYSKRLESQ
ncbi:MAG: rhomboid family intramembrane serine protease [Candidatus Kapabacteria bacterium]|nr:rhomboid family intramembrane serine protease [Ignavibacteriota bacterium]MCW5885218.1 rhomboid family intramembrane serine protease [Candidatus Kapabacteria bacterium]